MLCMSVVMLCLAMLMPMTVWAKRPPRVATTARPNIVVLMIDDLPAMSPRLLKKAPEVRNLFFTQPALAFSDYVGNDPLCCPGRANVLTGQTADHNGVVRLDARLLDPRETIGTELQSAGYWTAYSGKYLNKMRLLDDKLPPGWNKAMMFGAGYEGTNTWVNGEKVKSPVYSTEFVRRKADTFLRAAPPGKPVFLFLSPYAVHRDMRNDSGLPTPDAQYVADPRCADIAPYTPPSYDEADVSDKPAYVQALTSKYPAGWPLVKVCEALLSVNDVVATVRADLAAEGRTNVVWVLTADNGMAWGAHNWSYKDVPYAAPMPLYVSWPGVVTASRTSHATLWNVDIAPTLCAIAGCMMGPYPNGYGADGLSFLPLVEGTVTTLDRQWIYVQDLGTGEAGEQAAPAWHGVRSTAANPLGRWEYTEYVTGECELYDLSADPWELTNLCHLPAYAGQQAAAAAALAAFRG
jgi:N-acetylglucosamine-6-sulfatase